MLKRILSICFVLLIVCALSVTAQEREYTVTGTIKWIKVILDRNEVPYYVILLNERSGEIRVMHNATTNIGLDPVPLGEPPIRNLVGMRVKITYFIKVIKLGEGGEEFVGWATSIMKD